MNRRSLAAAMVLLPIHQSSAKAAPSKGAAEAHQEGLVHTESWKKGWDSAKECFFIPGHDYADRN